jgi:hypothetical protein
MDRSVWCCEPRSHFTERILKRSGEFTVVREETVTSWNDWRMAVAWLMTIGIAAMIYFLPAARLVE